ncbi:hypothetical protein E2542_SST31049 [Spatholobus suberectus]|nr:hypothetical protein E2542_SST31048 [Spatholobus suberectus]TKY44771.1 hypothetical protein E2542_SST31049 [Spatholobus suberectus]
MLQTAGAVRLMAPTLRLSPNSSRNCLASVIIGQKTLEGLAVVFKRGQQAAGIAVGSGKVINPPRQAKVVVRFVTGGTGTMGGMMAELSMEKKRRFRERRRAVDATLLEPILQKARLIDTQALDEYLSALACGG